MSTSLQLNRFFSNQDIFVFRHGLLVFTLSREDARILIEKLQKMLEDPKLEELVVVP